MLYDWFFGVYYYGNFEELYRFKEFFRSEIENNILGSFFVGELLSLLKLKYWFVVYLYVKFLALISYEC